MSSVPVALGSRRARPLLSLRARTLLTGYAYLVPAALCLLATVAVPIGKAIQMSLYADVLYKPQDYKFTGLDNYIRLAQDPVFWLSLWNSFIWVFGSVVLQFVVGFAAALLLHQAFFGRTLLRTLLLLPWVIPGVVVGLIWEWLYQPNYGVINDLLISAGWLHDRVAWLSKACFCEESKGGISDMSEQIYVTIVNTKKEVLVKDLEMDWVPSRGARIDWQHQQPFVIGVVRGEKWTSPNGVTLLIVDREATAGPNDVPPYESDDRAYEVHA